MIRLRWLLGISFCSILCGAGWLGRAQSPAGRARIELPTSKLLVTPAPGNPQKLNSFPTAVALSPDGRYLAVLNNGYGTADSGYDQSIAVLDLSSNRLSDYPDPRLGKSARQTYFLGLGFSGDGARLYASIASLTDPEGKAPGDLGNGIAVYKFESGRVTPDRFMKIPLQTLAPGHNPTKVSFTVEKGKAVPYPAGLAVIHAAGSERLLVADNLSDDALLLDANSGEILHRFDLSAHPDVPASYPYAVVATRDGKRGYCSLWNEREVAELDLDAGSVTRRISLPSPLSPGGDSAIAAGPHPTAMLLSPDEKRLYVALANFDRVAVVDTATGKVTSVLSTELPGQQYGGTFPNALAQSADGSRLFVADASQDAVALFDMTGSSVQGGSLPTLVPQHAAGFIPTEWYPTALAVRGDDLFIATGKGEGTGPNSAILPSSDRSSSAGPPEKHPYIAALIHGSVARVGIRDAEAELAKMTAQVEASNRMRSTVEPIRFAGGRNPIKHVIYIIKENRSYDQIFGDLKGANGDASLCMFCEDITPNEHKLARQFGILDNFYVSGEVSGNGHVWSTAGITSDYTEKTWEIGYRSSERTYDYEGEVGRSFPIEQGIADVDEPGTGYLWADVARSGLSHRNYGEFVATEWCNDLARRPQPSPKEGTPPAPSQACAQTFIHPGEPLPANVGQPHGSASPWPWLVPIIARDLATKPELRNHFDPNFADFNLYYPDQLRTDEFLNEFGGFVRARAAGTKDTLPQFVILRLPDDHTMGTRPGGPRPAASVADNDLAVGRVVEAVSHSPYWADTAIFIVEDDAQDGPDHVDAHRSPALVISKYSPGTAEHPFVDSHFYTTVSMIRTMEMLLGLPPMNNNDALAAVMAPLFAGPGTQPPFTADARNRENGLLYQVNPANAPGAKASARMDFSHADAAPAARLNAILWRDRKGTAPQPAPRHTVIPDGDE
ncbi:MAG TPA: phosphoesterase [Terriglobia bacterium]|nr:phosphoesterase [Terriglobia bacterium]